jgi:hypothetical protein
MEGTACCYVPEGLKPGNFFMLLDAGLKACSTLARLCASLRLAGRAKAPVPTRTVAIWNFA